MKLRTLDLFSGIGGFSLGLERTNGFETVAFCEIDPFCRKVLAKHWPDVLCFEDITKLDKEELDSLGRIDVICGGFPCQDISCAGKGAGIHAERSGLWWEMLRIVRLVRPRFVLVENVAALLNRGLDEVLGSLAESGYDAEWQILRASDFGLPHRRERVFVIGCVSYDEGVSDRHRELVYGRGRKTRINWSGIHEPCLGREFYGIPGRVDRLKALGNAIVPQCSQFVGQCVLDSMEVDA